MSIKYNFCVVAQYLNPHPEAAFCWFLNKNLTKAISGLRVRFIARPCPPYFVLRKARLEFELSSSNSRHYGQTNYNKMHAKSSYFPLKAPTVEPSDSQYCSGFCFRPGTQICSTQDQTNSSKPPGYPYKSEG